MILVLDAQHPEHERELEQFYINFAQTNSLTVKQCLVVAVQVAKEGAYGLGGWSGERACGVGGGEGGERLPWHSRLRATFGGAMQRCTEVRC